MEKEAVKQNIENDPLDKMEQCGERAQYHNLVDILFVIDATGSMGWCMDQMKKTVCKIMKKFSDQQYNIKFAIELYRDHQPQDFTYVQKHFDLRNIDETIKVIDDECEVGGGGDIPQAVFDGLVNGLKKTSWRIGKDGSTKSKRFLFHGCDAPPHGKEYGRSSSSNQWTQKGCPCGLTRHDVKKLLDEYNVNYSLIKCGTQVETMASLFKQCYAERFRRQIQIKQKAFKKSKHSRQRKFQRKLSEEYMEQIQREEKGLSSDICSQQSISSDYDACRYQQRQQCISIQQEKKQGRRKSLRMRSRSRSLQKIKKAKKAKKVNKNKKKKQVVSSSSSSDQQGNRSMASLVLSDIQSGIEDQK